MKYYRVKPNWDNYRRSDGSILVAHELYTQRELLKHKIDERRCDLIEVSKDKTYFLFGARFQLAK